MYSFFYNSLKKCELIEKIEFREINNKIVPKTYIPNKIKEYILKKIKKGIETEEIMLNNQKIRFQFFMETNKYSLDIYKKYVQKMYIWLKMMDNLCKNNGCNSTDLLVCIYFTNLKKQLPSKNKEVIDEYNVNGGYTSTCPSYDNEIVIYRKEEWFKVFIHESIHNRAFDFSDLSKIELAPYHLKILNLYKIKSEVNLYEAYTETWARIIYCLLISFENSNQSYRQYSTKINEIMKKEEKHMGGQCLKIMRHFEIGETNNDFYLGKGKELYKENTNVLSYYFLTYIFFIKRIKFMELGICFPKTLSDKKKRLEYLVLLIESTFFNIEYPLTIKNDKSLKMMLHS